MRFLRESILFRYLWLAMALHIFNCSVDMPDARPDSVPEDLSINDMESVVEVVLEEIMGIDNAIAEHDEPDDEDRDGFTIKKEIDFFCVTRYFRLRGFSLPVFHYRPAVYALVYTAPFVPALAPPPPQNAVVI